jgi:hypothetical protein
MKHTGIWTIIFIALCCLTITPVTLHAQVSQSLSVTPPLFQLSVIPGNIWQSGVKVVNANPYELTVYAQVVNFAPQGEKGYGNFLPVQEREKNGVTLAEWMTVQPGPFVIQPEQSMDISVLVEIPSDAAPGGHFAAILISTEPPPEDGVIALRTSQVVTSLFFVRVAGDIKELGSIREFSVAKRIVDIPQSTFKLRFENKGNVLLQPQGNIAITNMWGKERGLVPINTRTHFGNVLPESIREYIFDWKGELSITDIGRYKAIVVLTFGEDERQNVSAIVYFWVIPIKATLITLAFLAGFIYFVFMMIRLYVRRMLYIAGIDVDESDSVDHFIDRDDDIKVASYKTVTGPLRAGARDLRDRLSGVHKFLDVVVTFYEFVVTYKRFFGALLILSVSLVGAVFYIGEAAKEQRYYEVTIDTGETAITVNSEEIQKEKLSEDRKTPTVNDSQHFTLELVNATKEPGTAAYVALTLEDEGYRIDTLRAEVEREQKRTVVIYDRTLIEEARALSATLDGALLSGRTEDPESETPNITVIVGEDQVNTE